MRNLCARTLAQRKLPVENRLGSGDFDPTSNKIKVMTMKFSEGPEFPVVVAPGFGAGHPPAEGEDEKESTRVFYVAATRATQRLVMGVGGGRNSGQLWLAIQIISHNRKRFSEKIAIKIKCLCAHIIAKQYSNQSINMLVKG